MKRTLIVLVVGLLAVGCASLRDSVVGEYERKDEDGNTYKRVFLDNGVYEYHYNGKKEEEFKWSIVDGEIHIEYGSGVFNVYRINAAQPTKGSPIPTIPLPRDLSESITLLAFIDDGKRTDIPKEDQYTFKKTLSHW